MFFSSKKDTELNKKWVFDKNSSFYKNRVFKVFERKTKAKKNSTKTIEITIKEE